MGVRVASWAAEVVVGQAGTAGVKPPPHTHTQTHTDTHTSPWLGTRPLLTQARSGSSVSSIPLGVT